MHDDYPIEQVVRHARSRFQIGFARLTMHMLPDLDDVAYEPSFEGLRILGASELALETPGDIVRQIHAGEVEFEAPRVRLAYHGQVYEPVMGVRASIGEADVAPVVEDLLERGAKLEEIDRRHGRATVRATGRLRVLLGYPRALAHFSDDGTDLAMWLSHYAPANEEQRARR